MTADLHPYQDAERVSAEDDARWQERLREFGAYFEMLCGLASKTDDEQRRSDLFDRIERVIAETEAWVLEAATLPVASSPVGGERHG